MKTNGNENLPVRFNMGITQTLFIGDYLKAGLHACTKGDMKGWYTNYRAVRQLIDYHPNVGQANNDYLDRLELKINSFFNKKVQPSGIDDMTSSSINHKIDTVLYRYISLYVKRMTRCMDLMGLFNPDADHDEVDILGEGE